MPCKDNLGRLNLVLLGELDDHCVSSDRAITYTLLRVSCRNVQNHAPTCRRVRGHDYALLLAVLQEIVLGQVWVQSEWNVASKARA